MSLFVLPFCYTTLEFNFFGPRFGICKLERALEVRRTVFPTGSPTLALIFYRGIYRDVLGHVFSELEALVLVTALRCTYYDYSHLTNEEIKA